MQTPADPLDAAALETALAPGQVRHFRHRLEVDWDGDGTWDHTLSDLTPAVIQVQVSRELDDSTPGSPVVLSGAAAGELTVTLEGSVLVSGEHVPISEVLAPYNSSSDLYRVDPAGIAIRWSILTGTDRGFISTRQFTGWIDQRQVQRAENRVVLTALDIPPKLRDPSFWPPWAVDGPAAARLRDYAPQRGLASSVVDHIFNRAELYTRPRPPWETDTGVRCLAYLPLCGSFAPARGKQISQAPWGNFQLFPATYPISPGRDPEGSYWVDGQWGLARDGEANRDPGSLIYTTSDIQPTWTGYSSSVTAWIYCGPTAPGYDDDPTSSVRPQVAAVYYGAGTGSGNFYAFRLSIGSDGQDVQVQVEPGTNRHYRATHTPATDGWRHVHAELDHSVSPPVARLVVDGTQQATFSVTGTSNSVAATALNVLFFPQVGFHLRPGVRMSDAMAWQEEGSPTVTPSRTVTAGASVDRSFNEISFVPRPGESGWEDVRDIAAAEYATVLADETGHVYFRNRETVRSSVDPQTITLDHPSDLGTLDSEQGRANAALVSAQPGEASWQLAWEASSVDSVVAPPGVTTWIVPLDDDVIAIESGTVPRLYQSAESAATEPVWSGSVSSGYVFVYDSTETESDDQNMLSLTDQSGLEDKQFARIVVTNTDTRTGRFRLKSDGTAGTDPQPALRIAGLVLARPPVEEATVVSQANIDADGVTRTLNITGGDWRQHLPSVEASAYFALRRATQPIPTFDRFQVPGDPRKQLTDRVTLELGKSGPRVKAYIAGITRTLDDQGLREDLTIRATHAPGRWALGDSTLGKLESTAVVG